MDNDSGDDGLNTGVASGGPGIQDPIRKFKKISKFEIVK